MAMTRGRLALLILGSVIGFHFLLGFSNEEYGRATSIRNWSGGGNRGSLAPGPVYDQATVGVRKANAALIMLARNRDWKGVLNSMKQVEDRFNKKYNYPWIFLNDEPFDDEFIRWTTEVTDSPTSYGQVPKEHWVQPDWIDEEKAKASRQDMVDNNVIYGGSVSYRNMCRFNSGFFYRHELLKDLQYYWRVEPDTDFYCDINYDPFLFMQDNNKTYGFTITIHEFERTIPTLWETTKEFIKDHPEHVPKKNAMGFVSDDKGDTYNLCHFWSNFEIADLSFWRSEAYSQYFDFLESKGGFYYERWGDAPVHSIAASLFLPKEKIHWFYDIGYRHNPYTHCPVGQAHKNGRCWCDVYDNFDDNGYSCTKQWERIWK